MMSGLPQRCSHARVEHEVLSALVMCKHLILRASSIDVLRQVRLAAVRSGRGSDERAGGTHGQSHRLISRADVTEAPFSGRRQLCGSGVLSRLFGTGIALSFARRPGCAAGLQADRCA